MTITLNDASEMGGAILLDGVLGNNSLSVFGSSAFQGNNAGSTGQDIAVASAGTVTFDSDTNAANVDGAGVGDFAWQPIVSVQPNTSRADAFPSFLEPEESWIVEAQQVCTTHEYFFAYAPVCYAEYTLYLSRSPDCGRNPLFHQRHCAACRVC